MSKPLSSSGGERGFPTVYPAASQATRHKSLFEWPASFANRGVRSPVRPIEVWHKCPELQRLDHRSSTVFLLQAKSAVCKAAPSRQHSPVRSMQSKTRAKYGLWRPGHLLAVVPVLPDSLEIRTNGWAAANALPSRFDQNLPHRAWTFFGNPTEPIRIRRCVLAWDQAKVTADDLRSLKPFGIVHACQERFGCTNAYSRNSTQQNNSWLLVGQAAKHPIRPLNLTVVKMQIIDELITL